MDNKDGITLSWHDYYDLHGKLDEVRAENARLKKTLADVNLNLAQHVMVQIAAQYGKLIVTDDQIIYGPKQNTEVYGLIQNFPKSIGASPGDWASILHNIFYSVVKQMKP